VARLHEALAFKTGRKTNQRVTARDGDAMKSILCSLLLSLGMYGCAQSAMAQAAPVAVPVPALSATEKVAVGATFKDYQAATQAQQQAMGQLHAIEMDIAAAHPGYRFDEATGGLAKLPEVAKAAVKPGVKPVDLAHPAPLVVAPAKK
jgi:hypothetical protein